MPFHVIDVMPRFFTYWDRDRPALGQDTAAMVRAFRARVVTPDSAFFARAARGPSDAAIRSYLGRVGPDVAAMRVISARLQGDLGRTLTTFMDSLPNFAFDGSVYVYPSLYIRDAGVTDFPPSVAMMFGVDFIAHRDGERANLAVLFDHELFHLYHHQMHPEARGPYPLFMSVWGEGLATYASGRLNPGRSERELLLDPALVAATPRVPELAARLLRQMDDTSSVIAAPYLHSNTADPNVPPRSGYLLGLRVAQAMGRTRPLAVLAKLDADSVRAEMSEILHQLADSSSRERASSLGTRQQSPE